MLVDEIRQIRSDRRQLRHFGMLLGIISGLLGGWLLWRHQDWSLEFLAAAVLLILLSLFLPGFLKPLYAVWMALALILGWFATRILLILLFCLVLTPVGLIGRLLGKDFLDEGIDRSASTYWKNRPRGAYQRHDCERQY